MSFPKIINNAIGDYVKNDFLEMKVHITSIYVITYLI